MAVEKVVEEEIMSLDNCFLGYKTMTNLEMLVAEEEVVVVDNVIKTNLPFHLPGF